MCQRQKNFVCRSECIDTKRNLISVGGCVDTPVHVDAAGNADGKRPCLGNGKTVLMRTPTQAEFVEWSNFVGRDMDTGVQKDIWSVMEDFSKDPGGKDLSKMKTQYEMFVDAVGSKQVTV